jgi:hypothetical protein
MAKRGGDERKNRGIAALTNCQACLIFPLHRQREILIGKNNTYSDTIKTHHSAGFIL